MSKRSSYGAAQRIAQDMGGAKGDSMPELSLREQVALERRREEAETKADSRQAEVSTFGSEPVLDRSGKLVDNNVIMERVLRGKSEGMQTNPDARPHRRRKKNR